MGNLDPGNFAGEKGRRRRGKGDKIGGFLVGTAAAFKSRSANS